MKILVIEDEASLTDVIASRLRQENFTADVCHNGDDGLYSALSGVYDLVILDVMLPGTSGFEILRELRRKKITSKIIMLTARSMLSDKLTGLEGGANYYITKPFHMDELVARINIQLRDPASFQRRNILACGDIELDTSRSMLMRPDTGEKIELVRKELQLMEYFMSNPGQHFRQLVICREPFHQQ